MTWHRIKFPHYFYQRWDGLFVEVTTPCAGSVTYYEDMLVNDLEISKTLKK